MVKIVTALAEEVDTTVTVLAEEATQLTLDMTVIIWVELAVDMTVTVWEVKEVAEDLLHRVDSDMEMSEDTVAVDLMDHRDYQAAILVVMMLEIL